MSSLFSSEIKREGELIVGGIGLLVDRSCSHSAGTLLILIEPLTLRSISIVLLGIHFLLLLGLIENSLLNALYNSLIAVSDHLVDAHVGGGALSDEARLGDG